LPVFGFLDIRKDLVPALLPILEDCLLLREGAAVDVVCCPETVVPAEVLPIVLIFGAGSCGAGGGLGFGGGVGAGGSTLGGAGGGGGGVGLGGAGG